MNIKIKIEMTKYNLKQWQTAKLLNISESAFSRMLRKELSKEEQERIINIIRERGVTYGK